MTNETKMVDEGDGGTGERLFMRTVGPIRAEGGSPRAVAEAIAMAAFRVERSGRLGVRYWRENWYGWTGACYERVPDKAFRVWVRNDPGEILAGKATTFDDNAAVVVRSEGRDANGMSVVVVEAGLARSWAAAADPNKYGAGKNVNAFNTSAAAGAVNWNQ